MTNPATKKKILIVTNGTDSFSTARNKMIVEKLGSEYDIEIFDMSDIEKQPQRDAFYFVDEMSKIPEIIPNLYPKIDAYRPEQRRKRWGKPKLNRS